MDATTYEKLTARERGVLLAAATGQSAKQIGQALGISHRTVEDAQYSARTKLGVTRTVVAGQLLVAYEAALKAPVEIPEAAPVAESVADTAVYPAFGAADVLPRPRPSPAIGSVFREAPAQFGGASFDRRHSGAGWAGNTKRQADGLQRHLLVVMAWAAGMAGLLTLAVFLYLGVTAAQQLLFGFH